MIFIFNSVCLFFCVFHLFQVIHGVQIETVETPVDQLQNQQQQQREDNGKVTTSATSTATTQHRSRSKRSIEERPLRISLIYDDSVIG